eukprot:m.644566 g.644566  ORF g.644566 m.644566 type:complete len:1057 (+) comp22650_c0_seq5:578-3748(+)
MGLADMEVLAELDFDKCASQETLSSSCFCAGDTGSLWCIAGCISNGGEFVHLYCSQAERNDRDDTRNESYLLSTWRLADVAPHASEYATTVDCIVVQHLEGGNPEKLPPRVLVVCGTSRGNVHGLYANLDMLVKPTVTKIDSGPSVNVVPVTVESSTNMRTGVLDSCSSNTNAPSILRNASTTTYGAGYVHAVKIVSPVAGTVRGVDVLVVSDYDEAPRGSSSRYCGNRGTHVHFFTWYLTNGGRNTVSENWVSQIGTVEHRHKHAELPTSYTATPENEHACTTGPNGCPMTLLSIKIAAQRTQHTNVEYVDTLDVSQRLVACMRLFQSATRCCGCKQPIAPATVCLVGLPGSTGSVVALPLYRCPTATRVAVLPSVSIHVSTLVSVWHALEEVVCGVVPLRMHVDVDVDTVAVVGRSGRMHLLSRHGSDSLAANVYGIREVHATGGGGVVGAWASPLTGGIAVLHCNGVVQMYSIPDENTQCTRAQRSLHLRPATACHIAQGITGMCVIRNNTQQHTTKGRIPNVCVVFECGRAAFAWLEPFARVRTSDSVVPVVTTLPNTSSTTALHEHSHTLEELRARVEASAQEQAAIDTHIKELHIALDLLSQPASGVTWQPSSIGNKWGRFMPVHITAAVAGARPCQTWTGQSTGPLDSHAPLVSITVDRIPPELVQSPRWSLVVVLHEGYSSTSGRVFQPGADRAPSATYTFPLAATAVPTATCVGAHGNTASGHVFMLVVSVPIDPAGSGHGTRDGLHLPVTVKCYLSYDITSHTFPDLPAPTSTTPSAFDENARQTLFLLDAAELDALDYLVHHNMVRACAPAARGCAFGRAVSQCNATVPPRSPFSTPDTSTDLFCRQVVVPLLVVTALCRQGDELAACTADILLLALLSLPCNARDGPVHRRAASETVGQPHATGSGGSRLSVQTWEGHIVELSATAVAAEALSADEGTDLHITIASAHAGSVCALRAGLLRRVWHALLVEKYSSALLARHILSLSRTECTATETGTQTVKEIADQQLASLATVETDLHSPHTTAAQIAALADTTARLLDKVRSQ